MCTLLDGTVCEERAYLRGECPAPRNQQMLFAPHTFFMVPVSRTNSWVSNFHIFTSNDLSKPYVTAQLPQLNNGNYVTRANQEPRFFESTALYIVAYVQGS